MSIPAVIFNPLANQIPVIENVEKVLGVLQENAAKDWTPGANVPANLQAKIADAKKNVAAALADLRAVWDGYVVANGGA